MFHPLIHPEDGVVELSDAFPKWHAGDNHVWQLLKFVQFIFHNVENCIIQPENVPNNDAYELMMENRADFLQRVEQCIEDSQQKLYDQPSELDRNYICFDRFNPEVHGPVLESMKQSKCAEVSTPPSSGLSWVRKGIYQPMSK